MIWIAYSAMWLSTGAAVVFATHITQSGWCLMALLIPALVAVNSDTNTTEKGTDNGDG